MRARAVARFAPCGFAYRNAVRKLHGSSESAPAPAENDNLYRGRRIIDPRNGSKSRMKSP
jgi:hypothetical protein